MAGFLKPLSLPLRRKSEIELLVKLKVIRQPIMFQLGSTLFVECESEDDLRAVYALLALTHWD